MFKNIGGRHALARMLGKDCLAVIRGSRDCVHAAGSSQGPTRILAEHAPGAGLVQGGKYPAALTASPLGHVTGTGCHVDTQSFSFLQSFNRLTQ